MTKSSEFLTQEKLTEKNVIEALITESLEDTKGQDIISLDVRQLTDVMDTMIIVSGTSSRHVKSLADNTITRLKEAGYRALGTEGTDEGEWVLVDFGSVVLHVMQPAIRKFYDLERLWSSPQNNNE